MTSSDRAERSDIDESRGHVRQKIIDRSILGVLATNPICQHIDELPALSTASGSSGATAGSVKG